jgi:hypothetical protein
MKKRNNTQEAGVPPLFLYLSLTIFFMFISPIAYVIYEFHVSFLSNIIIIISSAIPIYLFQIFSFRTYKRLINKPDMNMSYGILFSSIIGAVIYFIIFEIYLFYDYPLLVLPIIVLICFMIEGYIVKSTKEIPKRKIALGLFYMFFVNYFISIFMNLMIILFLADNIK